MCEFLCKLLSMRKVLDTFPLHLVLLDVGGLWSGCGVLYLQQWEADAGETLCMVHG